MHLSVGSLIIPIKADTNVAIAVIDTSTTCMTNQDSFIKSDRIIKMVMAQLRKNQQVAIVYFGFQGH